MRQYLLTFLGAAALALSVGSASCMQCTYSGRTGRLIDDEIRDESRINQAECAYIGHITNLSKLSCDVTVIDNASGPQGDIILYLEWAPRWRSLR